LERYFCGKSWGLTLGNQCMQSSQPVAIEYEIGSRSHCGLTILHYQEGKTVRRPRLSTGV